VDVGVLAGLDGSNDLPDVDAVLEDGVTDAMSRSATLWPIGMSWTALIEMVLSSS
jgi:hypothetical protein